jgi:hypothetical protein
VPIGLERKVDTQRRLEDARVVHENVKRPHGGLDLLEEGVQPLRLGQVEAKRCDRSVDLGCRLTIDERDPCAVGDETGDYRSTDSIGPAGDERGTAGE